ncbi:MAG: ABC transporter ATP-binding protein [Planctomycetes bacterium]|nr:ABC transporter ATP-binding protein [Planctomycetota bacterium]MCH9725501.1 ABC transporter ATP-binding protein [Planctomycetota bacterium]MCH9779032.1 ABC transporter ATP-binding protein [Planctomycetota bacterium]MCH9790510.1 ABC transporter ATP-binding protein [Planctomycetota bacterium]MDF1744886.1 ABC transporter ATP-binding protein [Gimesia sp.]
MNDSTEQLMVRELTKTFSITAESLPILSGVNLVLNRGEALAITGPSGSGKSTLLYILGVLDQPTSGEIIQFGENPFEFNATQQAEYRNQNIGFIFQDHHLMPQFSVLENVLIPTMVHQGITDDAEERARNLLERVGLHDRMHHRPAQISGGERQRVAVCRALINNPRLLLADEPTGNLDRSNTESIGKLLLEINQEQNTVLICVTHSRELAALFPKHQELRDGLLVSETA